MSLDSLDFAEKLIGKTKQEAIILCKNAKFIPACIREDEQVYFINADLRWDRVIYELDNGTVTKAVVG